MHTFQTTRRVPHSAAQMFALVADVEQYPSFVPLCEALSVRRRELDGKAETLVVDMTIAYGFLRETFTSRVRIDPQAMAITVAYLDGPFRHLDNRWRFLPAGEHASDIGFFIAYAFRSRSLQMLMGSVFDRAFRKFVAAFEARADAVYGRPRATPAGARAS